MGVGAMESLKINLRKSGIELLAKAVINEAHRLRDKPEVDSETISMVSKLVCQIAYLENLYTKKLVPDTNLDSFYHIAFDLIDKWKDYFKGNLANYSLVAMALHRSRYYHKLLLIDMAIELSKAIPKPASKYSSSPNSISFEQFTTIVHCQATHASVLDEEPDLRTLLLDTIHTFMAKQHTAQMVGKLRVKYMCQLAWSLCVIFPRESLPNLMTQLIQPIEEEFEQGVGDIFALIQIAYCMEYMKEIWAPPTNFGVKVVTKCKQILELEIKKSSLSTFEVVDVLNELGIVSITEKPVELLDVDIILPGAPGMIQLCIDVHGYQHYARNCEKPLGGSILKEKILLKAEYKYLQIPLSLWKILNKEQRKEYLSDAIKELTSN
jgi:hypothetical protein